MRNREAEQIRKKKKLEFVHRNRGTGAAEKNLRGKRTRASTEYKKGFMGKRESTRLLNKPVLLPTSRRKQRKTEAALAVRR